MPTIQQTVQDLRPDTPVLTPSGGTLAIQQSQFRCLLRLPNILLPLDAVVDTGAPLIYFPELVWTRLHEGIDFEWLPFAPGTNCPTTQIGRWWFTFQLARFLAPISMMDYRTEIKRTDVIAAFAFGNPPSPPRRKALPPIIIGLWGGLMEGSAIGIARDPANGRLLGELACA